VFSTILSFRSNNINITPVELITGFPSNLIITWKERKSLSSKVWVPLSCLVIVGSIPGTILLKNGDTTLIKIIFGFTIVFVGMEMFFREVQKEKLTSSKVVLAVIGIISGLLCGLFGIGALLAAYVSRTTSNSSSFRGNLCIVFLIENSFRILIYTLTGILNLSVLKLGIQLLPFMFIGLLIGIFLAKRLKEKLVKKAIIIMLMFSGISLIVNNMIQM
jgi:uncharacterized membrane protein YfcA